MGKLPSAAKTGGCKGALADRDAGRIERGEASLAGGEAQAAGIDFSQVSMSGTDARGGRGGLPLCRQPGSDGPCYKDQVPSAITLPTAFSCSAFEVRTTRFAHPVDSADADCCFSLLVVEMSRFEFSTLCRRSPLNLWSIEDIQTEKTHAQYQPQRHSCNRAHLE
jgi:hypothetical protein